MKAGALNNRSDVHGFTLIECLVALLIIAIVLASATKAIGQAIEDVKDNYAREAASWLADNEYNQFYLDGNFPDLGTSQKKVTMAGINFVETITISSTPNQYFRKIEISVSDEREPDYALYKTVNFIAQY